MEPSFAPRGVNSKDHASNTGLILNPSIRYLSVHDDDFMSVPGLDKDQRTTLNRVDWPNLFACQGGSEIHYDEEDIDFVPNELDNSWLTPKEIVARKDRRRGEQKETKYIAIRDPFKLLL